MNFKDYISLAIRTESKINPVTKEPFTKAQRLRHAAMGLITECGELIDAHKKHEFYGKPLDRVNTEEEAGDLAWYLALLFDVSCISVTDKIEPYEADLMEVIALILARVSIDFLTYGVEDAYNCFVDNPLETCLMLYACLLRICENEKLSLSSVLDKNIAKLQARYPDKFDSDKAINRDLKKEREVLEG